MKLINQSFEILEQKDFTLKGIKQFIERCARVSYKSEDKITDDSYIKFVDMLEKRDHARPLEFGTVHLKMILPDFTGFIHNLLTIGMLNNIWIKHAYKGDVIYITTNYRYYLDIIKYFPNVKEYFTEEDNEYFPKRYTVHMILSRGVMDEFRTHVSLSHLAESTRYCNYSKDRFSDELTFIKPSWVESTENEAIVCKDINTPESCLVDVIEEVEVCYMSAISYGWTPQQARELLPLSVKSELISCGFKDAWTNFIRRRSPKYGGDPGAHPMAAEIANKLGEEFIKKSYINEKELLELNN